MDFFRIAVISVAMFTAGWGGGHVAELSQGGAANTPTGAPSVGVEMPLALDCPLVDIGGSAVHSC